MEVIVEGNKIIILFYKKVSRSYKKSIYAQYRTLYPNYEIELRCL